MARALFPNLVRMKKLFNEIGFQVFDVFFTILSYNQTRLNKNIIDVHREKNGIFGYADREVSDQPTYSDSLISVFINLLQKHWVLQSISINRDCSDQTVRMFTYSIQDLF